MTDRPHLITVLDRAAETIVERLRDLGLQLAPTGYGPRETNRVEERQFVELAVALAQIVAVTGVPPSPHPEEEARSR